MENISSENLILIVLLIIHLMILAVVASNYFYLLKIHSTHLITNQQPKLDIFIPARNEEQNIEQVVNSILQSEYINYRILILDDNSTDKTWQVVEGFAKTNQKIELINGKTLPENWLGKNWACHQLSQKSESEFMLFIDADVTLDRNAISFALNLMQNKKVDLLSIFPTQHIKSFGEQLVVPLMDWLLLTFLPLCKVLSSNSKSLSAANGQFMLFRTEAYKQFGGHEKIKNKIVEDIEFARGFKSIKKQIITLTGNNLVQCRMYSGFSEAVNGFSKNLYSGLNTNPFLFLMLLFTIFFIFIFPFIWSLFVIESILIILIILIQRYLSSVISKQNPVLNLVLFPVQMFIFIYVAVRSLLLTKSKKIVWKERTIL